MLAPVLEEIAQDYDGRVKVCKVNVDEETELADHFQVSSIPMLALLKKRQAGHEPRRLSPGRRSWRPSWTGRFDRVRPPKS